MNRIVSTLCLISITVNLVTLWFANVMLSGLLLPSWQLLLNLLAAGMTSWPIMLIVRPLRRVSVAEQERRKREFRP